MVLRVLLLFLFTQVSFAACVTKDDHGHVITLKTSAKRVISLAPDITENLFAIGAGTQIIAVIKGSDYPAKANQLPVVGSYSGLDLEKIITLKPDLIIAWGNTFQRQLLILKKFGIPIYINDPHRLEDIAHTLTQFACLTGQEENGKRVAQTYLTQLKQLSKTNLRQQRTRVFYQIGAYSLFTINKKSWIDQAISLCGGENIFHDNFLPSGEVTLESVIKANPELILTDAEGKTWQKRWQRFPTLSAVTHHALYSINGDYISRPTTRVLWGVGEICSKIEH